MDTLQIYEIRMLSLFLELNETGLCSEKTRSGKSVYYICSVSDNGKMTDGAF